MSRYYPWLDILLHSFNGITFTLLSVLWLREFRKSGRHWGGYLYLYITVACAVLFVSSLVNYLSWGMVYYGLPFVAYAQIAATALLPPLLYHFSIASKGHACPAAGFGRRVFIPSTHWGLGLRLWRSLPLAARARTT